MLTCYLVLLMGIPADLVFAPLGSAGGPATLFGVALMLWYLLLRQHPDIGIGRDRQPVRVAGLLFLCAVLAAYISANLHYLPRVEQDGADCGIITTVGWLAVLLITAEGIDTADRLRVLLGRITTGAAAVAVIGMVQFLTGVNAASYLAIPGLSVNQTPTDLFERSGFARPYATTSQPLEFAALLVIALPIAIHQARFAPPGQRGRPWLRVAIIGAAIPMTVSRTAMLGLVISAAVLLPAWPARHRRRAYALLAGAAAALFIAVPRLVGTLATLTTEIASGSASTDSRTAAISQALPYISQHLWFGSGLGTFPPQVYFFTDDQYLSAIITTGVVGLCCLLGLFVTGWFTARGLRRRSADPQVRDLAQSLAAAVAVAAACFATFDVLSFSMAAGLTFMIIGATGAAFRLLAAEGHRSGRPSGTGAG